MDIFRGHLQDHLFTFSAKLVYLFQKHLITMDYTTKGSLGITQGKTNLIFKRNLQTRLNDTRTKGQKDI